MQQTLSDTDYGLIGHPLGHSFSKAFFTALFAADGSGRSYDNFDLPELTPAALYAMTLLNPRLKGFNVTAPYKEAIIPYLDRLDESAKSAGAVNTVRICRADDGRVTALEGFNTDVTGFSESVRTLASDLSAGSRALVLGTGGASKAVVYALTKTGMQVTRVSRSSHGDGIITYDDLDQSVIAGHILIVNATPLGTMPRTDTCPPMPYSFVGPAHRAFDLVYNPGVTEFMKRCAAAGATVKNGLDMLHRQALAALKIWES